MALIPAKGVYSDNERVFPQKDQLHTLSHTINLGSVPGVRDAIRKYDELKNNVTGWFDFNRVDDPPRAGYSAELTSELTDFNSIVPKNGRYDRMTQSSDKSGKLSQEDLEKVALYKAIGDVEKEGYKIHFLSEKEMLQRFNDKKGYEIGRDIYINSELSKLEQLYVLGHERTAKNYSNHMANHARIRSAEEPFAKEYVSRAMKEMAN